MARIFKTCDPYYLFNWDEGSLSQVGQCSLLQNCTSRVRLADFPAKTLFNRVFIRHNDRVLDLETEDTRCAGVEPLVAFTETGLTLQDICVEVFDLIVRGHSCLEQSCVCSHHFSYPRCARLGLLHQNNSTGSCNLIANRRVITDDVVGSELGIGSLDTEFLPRTTMRGFLSNSGMFCTKEGEWKLLHSLVCDASSLLSFLKKTPLGTYDNNPLIQCKDLHVIVDRLAATGQVFKVQAEGGGTKLFLGNDAVKPADSEVRKLWHAAGL